MKQNNSYYIYGIQPSLEALNNPERQIKQVLTTKETFVKYKHLLSKFPHQILAPSELKKFAPAGANHQNLAIETSPLAPKSLEDLDFSNPNSKIAVLDQITDPRNIGAIIRSAAAFNLEAVILAHHNSPAENNTMIKAACGGFERVKIIRVKNIQKSISYLQKQGYWCTGLDENANQSLSSSHLIGKAIIALGSEEKGLKKLTAHSCDYLAKINTAPEFPSLNVSNAAAIAFSLINE
jgi:23S rRNA (guanosine2251-2'-O)-methyltransferase